MERGLISERINRVEGIVSKRKRLPYTSGPTSTWRKIKCPNYARTGEERPRSHKDRESGSND